MVPPSSYSKIEAGGWKNFRREAGNQNICIIHDFTSQETVTFRRKIYFILQLFINFLKHGSVLIKYYSLGLYIHTRGKTKFENLLSVASQTE
jgi:hypothetical protein